MKKNISFILIIVLLFYSCTHNIIQYQNEPKIEFYERLNNLCKDEVICIEFVNGQKSYGINFLISQDTTSFIDLTSNINQTIRTNDISKISFSQKERGVFEGFMLGTLMSVGIFLMTALLPRGTGHPGMSEKILIFLPLTCAFIGSVWGFFTESKTVIKIN
jgi:hypothetical protein